MFLNNNDHSIKFVVLFEIDSRDQAGVNILIPAGDVPLEEIVQSFSESKSEGEPQLCLDRISRPVGDGLCLLVCLRKKMDQGEKQHVIDITTREI